eukprot:jgi/Tetstr1/421439/TSEL_012388.t1
MMRLRMIVAYDGTRYRGFQLQSGQVMRQEFRNRASGWESVSTVQGVLEAAFGRVLKVGADCRVIVVGSSRTDTGVHARGQCCHVDVPESHRHVDPQVILHRLNRALPPDVSVCELRFAEPGFSAQYSVAGKCYHYRICCADWQDPTQRFTQWWVSGRWNVVNRGLPSAPGSYALDLGLMNAAAGMLVGTHDFVAFKDKNTSAQQSKCTVRTMTSLQVLEEHLPGNLTIVIEGEGFLFRMVRIIAAALVEVGAKRMPLSTIAQALESGDRLLMPGAAPPEGLSLIRIDMAEGFK